MWLISCRSEHRLLRHLFSSGSSATAMPASWPSPVRRNCNSPKYGPECDVGLTDRTRRSSGGTYAVGGERAADAIAQWRATPMSCAAADAVPVQTMQLAHDGLRVP